MTGAVRLRSGHPSSPCPLIPLWQSRRASMMRRAFRAAPHRVTSPFPGSVAVARWCPPSRSCRGASPPAHGFASGRDRGPTQGPLEHHGEPSRGSSRGTRKILDLRRVMPSRRPGLRDAHCGSGRDQSGRSKLGSQQSPRHGLTRRCSGRAAAGSEQPRASSFVWAPHFVPGRTPLNFIR